MFGLAKSVFISLTPLLILSPIIDSFFGELDKTKSGLRLVVEIFCHILVLILLWRYLESFIRTKFKLNNEIPEFIQGIFLVGLQKNLIDKLNYITYKHPIRLIKFFQ